MRIAFLILAHQYPEQLKKLLTALLAYPESQIYLHVDAKSEELFQQVHETYRHESRVTLLNQRYPVYWGSYNQIKATLALLQTAANCADYYCLISGQDMPIKPVRELAVFLKEQDKDFISWFQLPNEQWSGGGLNRLQYYSIDIPNHAYLTNRVNRVIHKLQRVVGYKRKIKGTFYGGPNWFNLSNASVVYILQYINKHPEYLRQFKHTRCADEIVIQSILLNSPLRERVVSDDLRLIDWASGPEYPRIWRQGDKSRLSGTKNKFFARKFNQETDPVIIDQILHHVL